jgi:hypothetical protein
MIMARYRQLGLHQFRKRKEIAMKKFLILFFLLSLIFLFMLSCAKTIGNKVKDEDIKALFERYEYVSNYNYFYTGYGDGPVAIVGINKDYELVKVSGRGNVTNWQQFEAGGEKLKELVDAIKAYRGPDRIGLTYGYIISTSGGDQLGVLYLTRLSNGGGIQIQLREGNRIAVSPHSYRGGGAP